MSQVPAGIVRHDPNHRRSRVVQHGGVLYFAGQVADDYTGDVAQQTREALARIDRMLAEFGTDKSHVLSCTIWLKTMDDFAAMNAVWDAWIDPANPPARACGKVEMARPDILVEIMPLAAVKA